MYYIHGSLVIILGFSFFYYLKIMQAYYFLCNKVCFNKSIRNIRLTYLSNMVTTSTTRNFTFPS